MAYVETFTIGCICESFLLITLKKERKKEMKSNQYEK